MLESNLPKWIQKLHAQREGSNGKRKKEILLSKSRVVLFSLTSRSLLKHPVSRVQIYFIDAMLGGGVVLIRKFLNSYLWFQLKKKTTCGNFLSLLLCLLLRFRVWQWHLVSTFWFTISYGRRSIFLCCVFCSISPPRSSFILETYTSRNFSKCFRQKDWTLESKGKIQRWNTSKQQ